jgi:tetratricopeptide (TPR) repeat protein
LFYRGVSIAPENIMPKNNLATEMVERKMYDEAITLYQQVLARNPNYWMASYNLGYVYYKLGRYEEAETYLARSIELNQVDSDQFARLALVRIKLGRLDEAADLLRQAIEMRPNANGYHYALGTILKQRGNTQGAIDEFEAELVNNPDQEAARGQLTDLKSKIESRQ